jgi:hypothetical protein
MFNSTVPGIDLATSAAVMFWALVSNVSPSPNHENDPFGRSPTDSWRRFLSRPANFGGMDREDQGSVVPLLWRIALTKRIKFRGIRVTGSIRLSNVAHSFKFDSLP